MAKNLIKHIQNFRTSGTVTPSSRFLVERLLGGIDFERARVIVQFGVGTGCVTRAILEQMRQDARLICLEINDDFVDDGAQIQDPRLTLRHACATTLPEILEREGIDAVDAVVSSLPLSLIDDATVDRILDVARDCLRPDGHFVQYQYSLNQRDRMSSRYRDVAVEFTLLNIPPAFIYQCSGPAESGEPRRVRALSGSIYASALAVVALIVRGF